MPVLGVGDHVLATAYTRRLPDAEANDRLRVDEGPASRPVDALLALPAMARVFVGRGSRDAGGARLADPVLRAAALSYYPGRSGDLIMVPKERWLFSTSVTTHGTQYPYDQRVPVILFGASVRPGRCTQAATPADIAPTLAAVARIRIAPVDGRVLTEAIVRQPEDRGEAPGARTRSAGRAAAAATGFAARVLTVVPTDSARPGSPPMATSRRPRQPAGAPRSRQHHAPAAGA